MPKTVQLTLTGHQRDSTSGETVTETTVTAEYYEKNDSLYLFYEEPLEGTETVVKNRIKQKGSSLELTKTGAISTRMVLETGREYLTDYLTPYGCLKLELLTHKLERTLQDGKIMIRAEYTLSSGGCPVSDCELEIVLGKNGN